MTDRNDLTLSAPQLRALQGLAGRAHDASVTVREMFANTKPIPVNVRHVDDNTPSGPWGPAEYGFWIEIEPLPERNADG